MSSEQSIFLEAEEEDVVLEGSDLHQALTDMGYTNFDLVPKVPVEIGFSNEELSDIKNYSSRNNSFQRKKDFVCQYIFEEHRLRREQLQAILESNILLDDHADMINDFLNEQQSCSYGKVLEWLPMISSLASAAFSYFIFERKGITSTALAATVFGFSTYTKLKRWNTTRSLRHLVELQNENHNYVKQYLKILRRIFGKKSKITKIHEKQELIGNEKYNTILLMKESLTKMFTNLSDFYYKEANHILSILPDLLHPQCILTKLENEHELGDHESYEKLKSLYYTFILVQSEIMLIIANAYNGKAHNTFFRMPLAEMTQVVKNLTKPLKMYNLELSRFLQTYETCDIQPVQRVFRGIPTSKWQDTYIHLDLTSQRIQLAYKEITSILEVLDLNSDQDENNLKLVETITEKMNEAYKQIENARSFAEFSSLLIAKAQHKTTNNAEKETDGENLFDKKNDKNRIIISADTEIEIEDEVFEEYIKEEYLKPLYESNEGIVQSFKIDKLLKKNFMSELKEALVEKQKTMTERELKALKRMYDRVRKNSIVNKTEIEKLSGSQTNDIDVSKPVLSARKEDQPIPPLQAPPLPPPPPASPPPITLRKVMIENINEEEEDEEELGKKKSRTPVPLPRVKMLQADDNMPYVQTFSISECTPNFKFPSNFKIAEETFLGSGENSEEDENNKNDNDEDFIEN